MSLVEWWLGPRGCASYWEIREQVGCAQMKMPRSKQRDKYKTPHL